MGGGRQGAREGGGRREGDSIVKGSRRTSSKCHSSPSSTKKNPSYSQRLKHMCVPVLYNLSQSKIQTLIHGACCRCTLLSCHRCSAARNRAVSATTVLSSPWALSWATLPQSQIMKFRQGLGLLAGLFDQSRFCLFLLLAAALGLLLLARARGRRRRHRLDDGRRFGLLLLLARILARAWIRLLLAAAATLWLLWNLVHDGGLGPARAGGLAVARARRGLVRHGQHGRRRQQGNGDGTQHLTKMEKIQRRPCCAPFIRQLGPPFCFSPDAYQS